MKPSVWLLQYVFFLILNNDNNNTHTIKVGDDIRICNNDDILPSGVIVGTNNRVVIPNVAIGRDPFLWTAPDKFNPERWMTYENGTPLPVRRPDEYVFPVFFAGRRLCLGKDMARFEAVIFMAKLFSALDITPLPEQDGNTMVMGPVIFLKDGLQCLIKEKH